MLPLTPTLITEYSAWLNQSHPKSRAHYLSFLRSLQRFFGGSNEIPTDRIDEWVESFGDAPARRTAKKCLRKYLAWVTGSKGVAVIIAALEIPAPARGIPDDRWAEIAARKAGPIHHRQLYIMALLHRTTALPASGIGQLLLEGVKIKDSAPSLLYKGTVYQIADEAIQALTSWLVIRERLASSPEDARLHRKSDAWARSPYLFPKADGSPSPYTVIWKMRAPKKTF